MRENGELAISQTHNTHMSWVANMLVPKKTNVAAIGFTIIYYQCSLLLLCLSSKSACHPWLIDDAFVPTTSSR